ncbi:SapC family protein [Sphingomonas sp. RT2P30]|uniref:SapC family protein n=1 Tax=Parasphingomonas halimpatiens TaxID=3096162 RepID=UPI002FCAC30C
MNIVLLNPVEHHDLRVIAERGAAWGDAVNQIAVLPTEFEAAQRDYPIVFRRDAQGDFQALALLGLDPSENLFLDETRWTTRHIPALLARGPFSIGLHERDDGAHEPMIHIDLDDPRVTRDRGVPLFRPHGGTSEMLDRMSELLRLIHVGHAAQAPMFAAFAAAGLIEPVRLEIQLDDTLRYDLVDFHTIGAASLAALDGAALERLHRAGFLALAFHVVASLGNIERLIALKNRKRALG